MEGSAASAREGPTDSCTGHGPCVPLHDCALETVSALLAAGRYAECVAAAATHLSTIVKRRPSSLSSSLALSVDLSSVTAQPPPDVALVGALVHCSCHALTELAAYDAAASLLALWDDYRHTQQQQQHEDGGPSERASCVGQLSDAVMLVDGLALAIASPFHQRHVSGAPPTAANPFDTAASAVWALIERHSRGNGKPMCSGGSSGSGGGGHVIVHRAPLTTIPMSDNCNNRQGKPSRMGGSNNPAVSTPDSSASSFVAVLNHQAVRLVRLAQQHCSQNDTSTVFPSPSYSSDAHPNGGGTEQALGRIAAWLREQQHQQQLRPCIADTTTAAAMSPLRAAAVAVVMVEGGGGNCGCHLFSGAETYAQWRIAEAFEAPAANNSSGRRPSVVLPFVKATQSLAAAAAEMDTEIDRVAALAATEKSPLPLGTDGNRQHPLRTESANGAATTTTNHNHQLSPLAASVLGRSAASLPRRATSVVTFAADPAVRVATGVWNAPERYHPSAFSSLATARVVVPPVAGPSLPKHRLALLLLRQQATSIAAARFALHVWQQSLIKKTDPMVSAGGAPASTASATATAGEEFMAAMDASHEAWAALNAIIEVRDNVNVAEQPLVSPAVDLFHLSALLELAEGSVALATTAAAATKASHDNNGNCFTHWCWKVLHRLRTELFAALDGQRPPNGAASTTRLRECRRCARMLSRCLELQAFASTATGGPRLHQCRPSSSRLTAADRGNAPVAGCLLLDSDAAAAAAVAPPPRRQLLVGALAAWSLALPDGGTAAPQSSAAWEQRTESVLSSSSSLSLTAAALWADDPQRAVRIALAYNNSTNTSKNGNGRSDGEGCDAYTAEALLRALLAPAQESGAHPLTRVLAPALMAALARLLLVRSSAGHAAPALVVAEAESLSRQVLSHEAADATAHRDTKSTGHRRSFSYAATVAATASSAPAAMWQSCAIAHEVLSDISLWRAHCTSRTPRPPPPPSSSSTASQPLHTLMSGCRSDNSGHGVVAGHADAAAMHMRAALLLHRRHNNSHDGVAGAHLRLGWCLLAIHQLLLRKEEGCSPMGGSGGWRAAVVEALACAEAAAAAAAVAEGSVPDSGADALRAHCVRALRQTAVR